MRSPTQYQVSRCSVVFYTQSASNNNLKDWKMKLRVTSTAVPLVAIWDWPHLLPGMENLLFYNSSQYWNKGCG